MSQRKPKYYKAALDKLKEEHGPVDPELLERNKFRTRMVRAVSKAISDKGFKTVPEINEFLDYSSDDIFRAVMHLMKYGGLKLISKRGEFPEYSFEGGH